MGESRKISDIKGLKYFKPLVKLLRDLHLDGCRRDRAANRKLHYDQYCLKTKKGTGVNSGTIHKKRPPSPFLLRRRIRLNSTRNRPQNIFHLVRHKFRWGFALFQGDIGRRVVDDPHFSFAQ